MGDGQPRRTWLWEPCVAAGLVVLSGWLASDLRRDAGQLAASTARATSELETLDALHRALHERRDALSRALPEVVAAAEAVVLGGEVGRRPNAPSCGAPTAGRGLSVDLHRGCAALILQSDAVVAVAPR